MLTSSTGIIQLWSLQWLHGHVCKQSAPRSRQITTPAPHHSLSTERTLFLAPNQQCQSTEGTSRESPRDRRSVYIVYCVVVGGPGSKLLCLFRRGYPECTASAGHPRTSLNLRCRLSGQGHTGSRSKHVHPPTQRFDDNYD